MRTRFLISFAVVIAVCLAAVSLFAQQAASQEVRSFLGRGGWLGAEELVQSLEAYYQQNGSWIGAESLLAARGHGQGMGAGRGANPGSNAMANLRLADQNGVILVSNSSAEIGLKASPAELDAATLLQIDGTTRGFLLAESGNTFQVAQFEQILLSRIRSASLQAALIAAAIALLLALLLTGILVRPLRKLTQAASELAGGNFAHRVHVKQPKELAALGEAFNQMAWSIEQAGENRKAMTADIAHELRTPLAVQRAHLEAIQDEVYPLTHQNLEPVLAQNLLLTRLVDDMRLLALADAGALQLNFETVDFVAVVNDMLTRFQAQADNRQITFEAKFNAEQPYIRADNERIQQVMHNLLQNGLRYTPPGGTLWLNLFNQNDSIVLELRDNGDGIAEEALPYIFDRFYRADKARDREQGGSGLGLAIARQLVLAHGGNLQAENHAQGGALFRLVLPNSTQAE